MNRPWLRLSLLKAYLGGGTVFDGVHYRESELTRLLNLFAHADHTRWKGMRVLEVGAGPGRLGDVFAALGFDVTSSDGRPSHVQRMKSRGRKAFVLDLDRETVANAGSFDLIVAFGVLYHLQDPSFFLQGCRNAKVLLIESAVCDSTQAVLEPVLERAGWLGGDQAVNRIGCRPSPRWVEEAVQAAGFGMVRDISSSIGNWSIGRFDWTPLGTGEWRRDGWNLRKMWVCERSGDGFASIKPEGGLVR